MAAHLRRRRQHARSAASRHDKGAAIAPGQDRLDVAGQQRADGRVQQVLEAVATRCAQTDGHVHLRGLLRARGGGSQQRRERCGRQRRRRWRERGRRWRGGQCARQRSDQRVHGRHGETRGAAAALHCRGARCAARQARLAGAHQRCDLRRRRGCRRQRRCRQLCRRLHARRVRWASAMHLARCAHAAHRGHAGTDGGAGDDRGQPAETEEVLRARAAGWRRRRSGRRRRRRKKTEEAGGGAAGQAHARNNAQQRRGGARAAATRRHCGKCSRLGQTARSGGRAAPARGRWRRSSRLQSARGRASGVRGAAERGRSAVFEAEAPPRGVRTQILVRQAPDRTIEAPAAPSHHASTSPASHKGTAGARSSGIAAAV